MGQNASIPIPHDIYIDDHNPISCNPGWNQVQHFSREAEPQPVHAKNEGSRGPLKNLNRAAPQGVWMRTENYHWNNVDGSCSNLNQMNLWIYLKICCHTETREWSFTAHWDNPHSFSFPFTLSTCNRTNQCHCPNQNWKTDPLFSTSGR